MGNLIEKAKAFARKAHAGQKYGEEPFEVHLVHAAEVARVFGLPDFVVAAIWLHDTLEDTDTTFEYLLFRFGPDVAWLVEAVTDEPGTRRERHPVTYAKIRGAGDMAVAVKLCDRIANVEYGLLPGGRKDLFKMYQKEYPEFKRVLQCGEYNRKLWERLDELMVDLD